MKSTKDCSDENIVAIKKSIARADAVVIGAGAGLSTSAGFEYSGERFQKNFADFAARYGFSDMYSGGFYPYKTLEEFWAFWSRAVFINRYSDAPLDVYGDLLKSVKGKNYFVITTNVDHCFQKAGFDKSRLFCAQGDYGLFQCSVPCCNKTYYNEAAIKKMVAAQKDMKIPRDLIPLCPVCKKIMTMNLRTDDTFVEDDGWHKAAARYKNFLDGAKNKRVVFLELGVGENTPGIIKHPFWKMTAENPNAVYICVNKDSAFAPEEISSRSICVEGDAGRVIKEMEA